MLWRCFSWRFVFRVFAQADELLEQVLEAPGGKKPTKGMQPGEADGGCPKLCTKYGWWPLGFLLACLVVVVWFTMIAAEASVTTEAERDAAVDLKERKKAFYERRDEQEEAVKAQAGQEEEEGFDVVAVFFMTFSVLLGVGGMYSFCTREKSAGASNFLLTLGSVFCSLNRLLPFWVCLAHSVARQ